MSPVSERSKRSSCLRPWLNENRLAFVPVNGSNVTHSIYQRIGVSNRRQLAAKVMPSEFCHSLKGRELRNICLTL
jgi:hypothetical protein